MREGEKKGCGMGGDRRVEFEGEEGWREGRDGGHENRKMEGGREGSVKGREKGWNLRVRKEGDERWRT